MIRSAEAAATPGSFTGHLTGSSGAGPAPGGSDWSVPAAGLCVYVFFFLLGALLGLPGLNMAGSFLLLYILLMGNHRRMFFLRMDMTVGVCLLLAASSGVNLLINHGLTGPGYYVKFLTMCLLYVLVFSYDYSPLYDNDQRKYMIAAILLVLLVSVISGRTFEQPGIRCLPGIRPGVIRSSGMFVNPNNLALMALALPMFINEEKDGLPAKAAIHLFVLFILALSATSGALIAYLAAWAYKARRKIFRAGPLLIALPALAAAPLYAGRLMEIQAVRKIAAQATVLRLYLPGVLRMQRLDYGRIMARYGASSLSGIWRVKQGLRALGVIAKGGLIHLLFGNGIGSSAYLLGSLPHNEYLRVLLEQGVAGFALVMGLFFMVARRLDKRYTHILLMFGVFCFTENNLDNLLFMSVFIFFIATAQMKVAGQKRWRLFKKA
ncbi:MAG: hypothetical protein M0Z58_08865 [Nitrospiraceae bacterium]|nr:hypothetical protein [Nitrospiraceae bacterium]